MSCKIEVQDLSDNRIIISLGNEELRDDSEESMSVATANQPTQFSNEQIVMLK